jgi:DNA primase
MEQAGLLRVQTGEVVIAYDADTAGHAATLRGLAGFKEGGMQRAGRRNSPRDMDPDDFIRQRGAPGLSTRKFWQKALPLVDYQLKKTREKYQGCMIPQGQDFLLPGSRKALAE